MKVKLTPLTHQTMAINKSNSEIILTFSYSNTHVIKVYRI